MKHESKVKANRVHVVAKRPKNKQCRYCQKSLMQRVHRPQLYCTVSESVDI